MTDMYSCAVLLAKHFHYKLKIVQARAKFNPFIIGMRFLLDLTRLPASALLSRVGSSISSARQWTDFSRHSIIFYDFTFKM